MEPDLPPRDDVSRFTELRDESLKLLDAARSSIAEMRTALEECKLYRPVVEVREPTGGGQPARPAARSHRGGRVTKKYRRRRLRPR